MCTTPPCIPFLCALKVAFTNYKIPKILLSVCSYLSLTFSDSEPSGKKVWGLRIDELPRDPKTGNLDFSTYNLDDKNHSAVPWLKVSSSPSIQGPMLQGLLTLSTSNSICISTLQPDLWEAFRSDFYLVPQWTRKAAAIYKSCTS